MPPRVCSIKDLKPCSWSECLQPDKFHGDIIDMLSNLAQQVRRFILRHNLFQHGKHVLVAVSGGADSVALLNILRELSRPFNLRLTVAHLNHKIRGRAAEEDARFVEKLAQKLGLHFAGGIAAVPRLADRLGISLEMAGRRARYAFFEKTAMARKCDFVATAHTADDSAESILIMLARGCGSQGLTGIAPAAGIGKIKVVRPFLGTDRKAIEKYLRARNLEWREDDSNADPAFLRNRVRHELLPLLEAKYNNGIRNALARLAEVQRDENELLDALAASIYSEACGKSEHSLDCAVIAGHPLALRRRVLRRWIKKNIIKAGMPDFQTINKLDHLVMNPAGGRFLQLPDGIKVMRIERQLKIESQKREKTAHYLIRIKAPGKTVLPDAGLIVKANIAPGLWRDRSILGKFPARASLSLKKWQRKKIVARDWRPGDRMRPYGLKGSKKIQDIFSDAKLPALMRHRLPVFACGREIIWIPGYRIAEGWQITDAGKNTLHLTVERTCEFPAGDYLCPR